jgi:hypothetical protein
MPLPDRVRRTLDRVGQVAAEVPGSGPDVRAFVSVSKFRRSAVLNGDALYAYLGSADVLYNARRFQVAREVIDNDWDVSEEELWLSQQIVVPDEEALEAVLRLWLEDVEQLQAPADPAYPI